jgi:hypothetical protein
MSPSVNHPLSSRAALVPAMLVGAASINAAGTIAFFAGFRAEGAAIFAGGIGALPSINDRGIVVFWGMRSATDQGIFTGKGGPLTTIVNTTAGFVSFSNPSTNNSDIVAFKAALAAGAQGVFVAKRGLLRTVAGTSGVFMGFADVVAINDRSTVAFLGLRTNRVQGFLSEAQNFCHCIASWT